MTIEVHRQGGAVSTGQPADEVDTAPRTHTEMSEVLAGIASGESIETEDGDLEYADDLEYDDEADVEEDEADDE